MARLDYFLTTPDIHSQLRKIEISHGYRTDHSLIHLEITPFNLKRGKGFWKFNTTLLYDPEYIQMVQKVIDDTAHNHTSTNNLNHGHNQMLFEMLKLNIRGHSIAYSALRKLKITGILNYNWKGK